MFQNGLILYLVVFYFSLCIGLYMKLTNYGVKEYKFIICLLGPVAIFVLSNIFSWSYLSQKEKDHKFELNFLIKVLYWLRMLVLNVTLFPFFGNSFSKAVLEVEGKRAYQSERAVRKKSIEKIRTKSFACYDKHNCMAYS